MDEIVYKKNGNKFIKGIVLYAFSVEENYKIISIKVYEDSTIGVGALGIYSLNEFITKVQNKEIVTQLPKNKNFELEIFQLFNLDLLKIKNKKIVELFPKNKNFEINVFNYFHMHGIIRSYKYEDEFIKEIKDKINILQGKISLRAIFQFRLKEFIQTPTKITQQKLQQSYIAIPQYQRKYLLGDMASLDYPIKELFQLKNYDDSYILYFKEKYKHLL